MVSFFDILDQSKWLQNIVGSMPRRLQACFSVMTVRAGDTFVRKGTPISHVYILMKGNVRVHNEYLNGKVLTFARTPVPGFIGLLEFFSSKNIAAATLTATEDSILLKIRQSDVELWLREDAGAVRKLAAVFASQLYPTIDNVEMLSAYTKERTLVNYLVQQYEDAVSGGERVKVKSTREELASTLNMSVRTIYRVVSSIEEMNCISVEHGRIYISKENMANMKRYIAEDEN